MTRHELLLDTPIARKRKRWEIRRGGSPRLRRALRGRRGYSAATATATATARDAAQINCASLGELELEAG
ncbi:hypothetical protein C3473_24485 [Mycobacterium kansasii]|nr:hypothetical protein C3473_24485 [Mycobacterium kansasii]